MRAMKPGVTTPPGSFGALDAAEDFGLALLSAGAGTDEHGHVEHEAGLVAFGGPLAFLHDEARGSFVVGEALGGAGDEAEEEGGPLLDGAAQRGLPVGAGLQAAFVQPDGDARIVQTECESEGGFPVLGGVADEDISARHVGGQRGDEVVRGEGELLLPALAQFARRRRRARRAGHAASR